MQSNRILYLTPDGLTDPLGQSQILPYLKGLALQGFSITIISWEKKVRFSRLAPVIRTICHNYGITWLPLTYYTFPPVLAPWVNILRMRNLAIKVWQKQPYQLVHCRSYLTSIVGVYLKQKVRVKFIFDMRGFWADERRESNLWPASSILYSQIYTYFKIQEKKFLREADHIITLTHAAADEIETWKLTNSKVSIIPTCVDLKHFNPVQVSDVEKQRLRQQLGIAEGNFVLLYLGSWGTWYLTDEMLQFFRSLNAKTQAKFLILTPDTNAIEREPNIIVREVNRNELPLYISLANASVFFIQPSFSKKGSAATKMGELMAMNIPIITNSGWGDVEKILTGVESTLLLKSFSTTEVKNAVSGLLLLSQNTSLRKLAFENFDLTKGVATYKSIYTSLLNSGGQ
jgi:glycosyltransferase involved in cell wall biosynthesis